MEKNIMLELDGAEGGGQLLRTALSLSICTGTPFRMRGIRAGRPRPGLMRQHLTAVQAARDISAARVTGAEPGSQQLEFTPGPARGGDYHFAIGTAGSTTLVLQTVLPALLQAAQPSTLLLEGGTHNPLAPPADFLIAAYAPLLRRMGAGVEIELERHGFFPAGGGALRVRISPAPLRPLHLPVRGAPLRRKARALVSSIPGAVAERELAVVARRLAFGADELEHRAVRPALGPGNALLIELAFEHLTEVFTGFGERGTSAEAVAERACAEAREYLDSAAAVGSHLADQLILPMALAGGGSFSTLAPSDHLRSNAAMIEKFLAVEIALAEDAAAPGRWNVSIDA